MPQLDMKHRKRMFTPQYRAVVMEGEPENQLGRGCNWVDSMKEFSGRTILVRRIDTHTYRQVDSNRPWDWWWDESWFTSLEPISTISEEDDDEEE